MKHKIFRGVRNILEGEPDDWLGQESVHRGLGTDTDYWYSNNGNTCNPLTQAGSCGSCR